ncbi:MAG: fibronectin type III domain-containing protein [archaeon]|nr:fibronectin type III domain-containing protein [archaeon]
MNKTILFCLIFSIILASGCTQGEDGGIPFLGGGEKPLNTPTNLSATAGDSEVNLSWDSNNVSVKGYNVYRSVVSSKNYLKINSQLIASTAFTDSELSNNLTYFYVITVLNDKDKESAYSLEVSAMPQVPDENVSEPTGLTLDECNSKINTLQKDLCLQDLALQNSDTTICELMKSISLDNCYSGIALNLNDEKICEKISAKRQSLRNECFNNVGISLNNKEICAKILENDSLRNSCIKTVSTALQATQGCAVIDEVFERDDCYKQLAVAGNNASYCSLMSTTLSSGTFVRDACLDSVLSSNKNTAVCGFYISSSKKNDCLKTVAISLSDETICNQITDQNRQDYCFSEINITLKQVSICYAIQHPDNNSLKTQCIEEAVLASPSRENCGLLVPGNNRDTCFYNLATSLNNDVTLCDGINFDLDLKDDCNQKVAIALNDGTLCSRIRSQNPDLRNQCYQTIAIANQDLTLCPSCTTSIYYIGCFSGIAQAINNDSVCENAVKNFQTTKYTSIDQCYYNFAIAVQSSSSCDKILNSTLRGYCDGNVSG